MTNPVFKKTIFISLLGHITVFSIFSFSFGNSFPKVEFAYVSFWGQFLRDSQVAQPITIGTGLTPPLRAGAGLISGPKQINIKPKREIFTRRPDTAILDKITKDSNLSSRYYLRPLLILTFSTEKEAFIEKSQAPLFYSRRREPAIIFHPLLPYSFTLYFKDRQIAHVELMFKMVPLGLRNSIVIKRKISSGNLEVDLLTMRYIGHYFFIQQPSILANNWQIVKIDLSAKND